VQTLRYKEAPLDSRYLSGAVAFLRASIAALMLPMLVQAVSPAQAQTQAAAYSDAELLAALEDAYWIALSGPQPKKVYVLAAPWCPNCRALHKTLSGHATDVEYRFILTAPMSQPDRVKIGYAAFSRQPAALDEVYGRGVNSGKTAAPAEVFADGFNDALWTAINPSLQARSAQPIGLPVLVLVSGGRVRVLAGVPSDLAALEAAVDATAAPASRPPKLTALLATTPELKPIAAKVAYARKDGTVLYSAPHPAAPKLLQLKAGVGFMAKATAVRDGERWYAFQFTAGGPPAAFGKAEDFR